MQACSRVCGGDPDLGVKEYEIVSTLDSKTSEICRSLDGKHFPMSEFKPGITAPPFHPWCRTTTVPYFNDEFTKGEMRAARDEDGKTYYVPADMKYREWELKYVIDKKQINNKIHRIMSKREILAEKILEKEKSIKRIENSKGIYIYKSEEISNKMLSGETISDHELKEYKRLKDNIENILPKEKEDLNNLIKNLKKRASG